MRVIEVGRQKVAGGKLAGCLVLAFAVGVALTSTAAARPTASGKSLELIEVSTGIPYYNPLVSAFKAEAAMGKPAVNEVILASMSGEKKCDACCKTDKVARTAADVKAVETKVAAAK